MKRILLISFLLVVAVLAKGQPSHHPLLAPSSIVSAATPTPLSGHSSYMVNRIVDGQVFLNPQYCDVNSAGFITRWVDAPLLPDSISLFRYGYLNDTIPQVSNKKYFQDPAAFKLESRFDSWGRVTSESIADSLGNTWFQRTNTWGPGPLYKGTRFDNRPPMSSQFSDTLIKVRFTGPVGQLRYDTLINFNRRVPFVERMRWDYFNGPTGTPTYAILTKKDILTGQPMKMDSLVFIRDNDTLKLVYWSVMPMVTPFKYVTYKYYPAPSFSEIFESNLELRIEDELENWLELPRKNFYKNGKIIIEGTTYKRTFTQSWSVAPSSQIAVLLRADTTYITSFSTGLIDSLSSGTLETNIFNPIIQGVDKRLQFQTIIAYPNPSTGLLLFKELELGSRFALSNTQGKEVFSGVWTGEPLELSNLPSGIYTLTTTSQTEPPKRSKWVKQ